MRKGFAAIAIALAASVAMSGCFFMRTLQYTDDKVERGKKTTAKISSTAATEVLRARMALRGSTSDQPFFLVATEETARVVKGGRFDTTGQFGGPYKLKKDPALAAYIESSDVCDGFFPVARPAARGTAGLTAIRTDEVVTATSDRKIVQSRVKLKVLDGFPKTTLGLFWASGGWVDDGDGIPEGSPDDSIYCTNGMLSTLVSK